MKIEKKTLAREIIILLSTLGLILLFFVGTETYNWIFNLKIDNRDKSISAINSEILLNNHLIDSLKYSDDPFNREKDNIRELWAILGSTVKGFAIGFEEFKSDMGDPVKQRELHNSLKKRGDYDDSFEVFHAQYLLSSVKKRDNATASSPTSIEEPIKDLWQLVHAQVQGFNVPLDRFKEDMKDNAKQERLYTTLAKRGDYKGSLSDFRSTYFKPTVSLPTSIEDPIRLL